MELYLEDVYFLTSREEIGCVVNESYLMGEVVVIAVKEKIALVERHVLLLGLKPELKPRLRVSFALQLILLDLEKNEEPK